MLCKGWIAYGLDFVPSFSLGFSKELILTMCSNNNCWFEFILLVCYYRSITPKQTPSAPPGLWPCCAFSLEGSLWPPRATFLGTQHSFIGIRTALGFSSVVALDSAPCLKLQFLKHRALLWHIFCPQHWWTADLFQQDERMKKRQRWVVPSGDRYAIPTRWHLSVASGGRAVRKLRQPHTSGMSLT